MFNFTFELVPILFSQYDQPSDLHILAELNPALKENVDILTALAERHYYNCEYQQAFKLTSKYVKNLFKFGLKFTRI